MAAAGIEVTRWFVFTDGRGGIRWTGDGGIAGLDAEFFDDMDAALEIAASQRRAPVPGAARFPVVRRSPAAPRPARSSRCVAFLDRVIDPFLDRYGKATAIHSFDLINEPDWVIQELATNPKRAVWPLDRLRTFAGLMSARIRARSPALITLGGGRVAPVREWDHPSYDLDFLQVHSYPGRAVSGSRRQRVWPYRGELRVEQAAADRRVSVASATASARTSLARVLPRGLSDPRARRRLPRRVAVELQGCRRIRRRRFNQTFVEAGFRREGPALIRARPRRNGNSSRRRSSC